jgi:predicted glycosyltransferase involved in capsule biosynthesis
MSTDELTIVIPFFNDGLYRINAVNELTCYLEKWGLKYYVIDNSTDKCNQLTHNKKVVFIGNDYSYIQKCKAINIGIENCKTEFCAWYDCDIRLFRETIIDSLRILYNNNESFVRPHNGKMINVYDYNYSQNFYEVCSYLPNQIVHNDSPGGAFFFRKSDMISIGGMNEMFNGWGYEDDEMYLRIEKHNYRYVSTGNPCYHINHPRSGFHSSDKSPSYVENVRIYNMIKELPFEDIKRIQISRFIQNIE